jgi:hypothetical protein
MSEKILCEARTTGSVIGVRVVVKEESRTAAGRVVNRQTPATTALQIDHSQIGLHPSASAQIHRYTSCHLYSILVASNRALVEEKTLDLLFLSGVAFFCPSKSHPKYRRAWTLCLTQTSLPLSLSLNTLQGVMSTKVARSRHI